MVVRRTKKSVVRFEKLQKIGSFPNDGSYISINLNKRVQKISFVLQIGVNNF